MSAHAFSSHHFSHVSRVIGGYRVSYRFTGDWACFQKNGYAKYEFLVWGGFILSQLEMVCILNTASGASI